jgi:hypothetical protein
MFIGLFPIKDDFYELTVLGKEINENSKLKLFDTISKITTEYKLIYGVNKIKINTGQVLKLAGVYKNDVILFYK